MAAPESTVLQLNFSTPGRSLLNVYISDPETAGQLLQDLLDLAPQISAAEKLFGAVSAVAPIVATAQAQPAQQQAASPHASGGLPEPFEKEFCQHGQMLWKTGVSGKGNPYGLWECSAKDPADPSRWPKRK